MRMVNPRSGETAKERRLHMLKTVNDLSANFAWLGKKRA